MKKLLLTIIMTLICLTSSLTYAEVNWTKENADITVTGIGLPPENAGYRSTVLARRAAIVDAYRNLAENIEGISLNADTTVRNYMVQNDTVNVKVQAFIKGAKILSESEEPNGKYTVRMNLPMYGDNSLASITFPGILPKNTEAFPTPKVNYGSKENYTGVIIDATGMNLEPTFSPVVYDTNNRAVYGIKNINPDFAISKGMVSYATSVEEAKNNSRSGNNPLVLNAIGVTAGKNSANRVNVIISEEDAEKLLSANAKTNFMKNCNVVFVK